MTTRYIPMPDHKTIFSIGVPTMTNFHRCSGLMRLVLSLMGEPGKSVTPEALDSYLRQMLADWIKCGPCGPQGFPPRPLHAPRRRVPLLAAPVSATPNIIAPGSQPEPPGGPLGDHLPSLGPVGRGSRTHSGISGGALSLALRSSAINDQVVKTNGRESGSEQCKRRKLGG